jgi:succinate dehydrogenase/fumarate reductase flavoprotein subunit
MNMRANTSWDCDLLVLGSGAGGLSAAVTAAHLGLQVIVAEKDPQLGGTTAWSGGWMWIPRNPLALAAGIAENIETPLSYLRHELADKFDETKARTYLENAPRMVRFFSQRTALQFIDGNGIPDFHGDTPDAATGGRSVCAAPFDGRRLGQTIAQLKSPLYETTFLGLGIASGAELRHYLNAMRSWTSFAYVTRRVAAYAWDWLRFGRSMRLVNGHALAGALLASAQEAGVQCHVNSPAIELLREGQRVVGAVLRTPQGDVTVRARHGVVLACGGFPHDIARKRDLLPHAPTGEEHKSAASRGNTGDGLRLGESVGAQVSRDLRQAAALAPVSLVPRADGSVAHFPHLIERAKPGLIAVTAAGRRFGNEADSYHDFVQQLLAALPAGEPAQAWLVCDHAFIRRYGLGAVKPAPVPLGGHLRSGYLKRGHTLQDLAAQCGINPAALQDTVARYNAQAEQGVDVDFAKGQTPYNRIQGDASNAGVNPCMAPLLKAPFYAVRIVTGSLGTFAGLPVTPHAQVLDAQQQVIPGLYACGNDASSMMGGNYPSGGITLGPAMTFGFLAAQHAAGRHVDTSFLSGTENTMYYEIATLTLSFGTAGKAAPAVAAFASEPAAKGELLGCWFSDIGVLNQMIVLRGFQSLDDLNAERQRTQHSANPLGCAEFAQAIEYTSYQGFPWMKPIRPSVESGIHGPVYEIRTYGIKTGGVQPTIDLWEQAVPERDKISPCVGAMVALDGSLRFTNIWAYPSVDARGKARADAVAQGIWPPKGGPAWLTTDMVSTIAMPTAVSPLK